MVMPQSYDGLTSCRGLFDPSGGIIASILAAVKPGSKLIMARNCHKSVFNIRREFLLCVRERRVRAISSAT